MVTDQSRLQNFRPARQSDKFASYFVFLLWPLLGTIISFRYFKLSNSKNLIWLFCSFVGLSFSFAEGTDSNFYKDNLKHLYAKGNYTFEEFWDYLFSTDSNSIDFLQPLINFLVSRVTDNEYFLFGIYGLIFGYFYSRNVWYLIKFVKHKIRIEAFAFLVLFAFLVPIWSINGFRYWTATHIFFYGLIKSFERQKSGWLLIICSFFMHYTYIIGIFLYVSYRLIGNRLNLLFIGYIISLFLTFVNIELISNYLEGFSSEKVKGRASGYLNEEYTELYFESEQNNNWYIKYRYSFIKLLVIGSYVWIFLTKRELIKSNPLMLKYFCIGLVFMSFANITVQIPAMGRFFYIGFMAVTVMLFMFFQLTKFKRRPDWYKVLTGFSVLVFCVVELRMGFDNMSVGTVLGNPFTLGFFETKSLLKAIRGG